ncbi:MAG: segregation and condensation protein A [Solirubrobacteraceae bacterium]
MPAAGLELDLDVFAGPFDLLLTLVLREEVDLLEVELADVVLAYLDHLERKGELALEVATEFLVLISSLLELKSRLMLPGPGDDELLELEPAQAAEELLARMLAHRRYRRAAEELALRLRRESGYRFRSAPVPAALRRASAADVPAGVYDPEQLGEALGTLLRHPPPIDVDHMHVVHPRISVAARLAHLRSLLRRGSFRFDEAVAGTDRLTVAMTLFALLDMHKRGEATWRQSRPFGDITVTGAGERHERGRARA